MAPIIEIKDNNEFERAKKILELSRVNYNFPSLESKAKTSSFNESNFVYVPSINTYFAKQRTNLGKNWFESHKLLQENGEKMPTIPEFLEFLKYLKDSNNQEYLEIFKDITQVRSPWRAEWLDADFKLKDNKLHINYNHKLDENGNLVPQNSEVIDKNTLMKDKTPGISLDDYLIKSHTGQGLPSKDIKSGDLYYWNPRSDNNSVARFYAGSDRANLDCGRGPSYRGASLGVRAAKQRE